MHGETISSMPTVSERNKSKVRLFIDSVWNEGRLELIDELVAADYVGRLSCLTTAVLGPDGVRWLVSRYRKVEPNLYVKVDEQVAENDLVVVRWRAIAGGPVSPMPAHHCWGISVIRMLGGKQVDSHTALRTKAGAPA